MTGIIMITRKHNVATGVMCGVQAPVANQTHRCPDLVNYTKTKRDHRYFVLVAQC